MRQEARGFTLIELLVTVAVVAVLMGIGVPGFQQARKRARTATTLHLLSSSLATARMAAVSRRRPVSVCPSGDGITCRRDLIWDDGWIVYEPGMGGSLAAPKIVLQHLDRVGANMVLRSTPGRHHVRFLPNGGAHGANASIRLCSAREREHLGSIIVNNAGRTRAERITSAPCPFAP